MWSSQLCLRFKQSQLSSKNVIGASTGFEPMASALVLQCSTNWAIKTHTLGAGKICWIHRTRERNETCEYYVNCGHTNERKVWSSHLCLRFKQSQLSPKNVIGASTGFEPMASALVLQCSTNWAMKTHTLGAGKICWIHRTRERNETCEYYVNCGHTNERKVWSSHLCLRFKQMQFRLKNVSGLIAIA